MEERNFNLLYKTFLLATILVLGILIFFAGQMFFSAKTIERQNQNQITVSGQGKVYAKPDIAVLNLGVKSEGSAVAGVIQDNTTKMNAIISAVKEIGILEEDIQTTNYSLVPNYNYTELAGRIFDGYVLDQNIQVKIRDFSKISNVLSQATLKGANLIGQLSFTIDNPEQFKQEARQKAIEQAKASAKNLASVSGVKLGKIVNVYENYNPYYRAYDNVMGMGGAEVSSAPMPTIEPGQQEIVVNVNLTYLIK